MRFILVDRILELKPGNRIRAEKGIALDEDYFPDHFPGFPVVPGVLLTEMMAQAAGKCLDAEFRPRGRAMLVQIKSASFREWVRPGDTAEIFAAIQSSQEAYATAECRIEVRGKTVCTAVLFFSFIPRSQFSPEHRDEVLMAYLEAQKV